MEPGTFNQPSIGPLAAIGRHKILTLLPVVLLVAVAVAYGLTRTPVYTAEARLSVGSPVVSPQAVPGVVAASQALAGTYSRAVADPSVIQRASAATNLSVDETRSALTASSVPQSAVILLDAKTDSRAQAIRLANAGADALRNYVRRLGDDDTQVTDALSRFDDLSTEIATLRRKLSRIRRTEDRTGDQAPGYVGIASKLESAKLRAQSLSSLYGQLQQGQLLPSPVTVIAAADSATSDKTRYLEKLILSALLIGVVVGVGLALLRANRRSLRIS